jgi:hypothetical protein
MDPPVIFEADPVRALAVDMVERMIRDAVTNVGFWKSAPCREEQRSLEIRERLARALVQARLDFRDEDVASPAVIDSLPRVPEPKLGTFELLEQRDVVEPGQSCKRPLHN